MSEKKITQAKRCLSLYDNAKESMNQEDVEVIISSCRAFIDSVYTYFAEQNDSIFHDFCNAKIFHNACRECIRLRHFSYLYSQETEEKLQDVYAERYWAANKELEKYMEIIKNHLG